MSEKSDHIADAVAWYIRLTSEDVSADEKQAWAIWLKQSRQNEIAWDEIKQTLSKIQSVPSDIGMSVLGREVSKVDLNKRASLKHFTVFSALAMTTGLLLKDSLIRDFYYDYSTKVGEREQITLLDGTLLALNTNTAVTVDISSSKRLIKLHHGEIFITTGHVSGFDKPIEIETPHGNIIPMGTKFNVREFNQFTRVNLFEGELKILPKHHNEPYYMVAKQEVDVSTLTVVFNPTTEKIANAWMNGYLEVNNISLKELIEELARYQQGIILCHPELQKIRVSGAYSIDDVDKSLNSLSQSLPVKIQSATRFLTILLPSG